MARSWPFVVEDEDPVRNIIVEVLRREGFTLIEAQNAGEAFLICEKHPKPIDLMLTDVVMPRMNGRELADRVAALRPEMKLMFMSGFDGGELEGTLATAPFLPKPITPTTLRQKVRQVLG